MEMRVPEKPGQTLDPGEEKRQGREGPWMTWPLPITGTAHAAHGSEAGANAHSLKCVPACACWGLKVNLGWGWLAYSGAFPLSLDSRTWMLL